MSPGMLSSPSVIHSKGNSAFRHEESGSHPNDSGPTLATLLLNLVQMQFSHDVISKLALNAVMLCWIAFVVGFSLRKRQPASMKRGPNNASRPKMV